MEVTIAFDEKEVREMSWQKAFPKTTKCLRCKGECRLGFVAHEGISETDKYEKGKSYVCQLYKNEPKGKGFWLHHACAVAVYFCKNCLEPTALYNQT